MSIIVKGMQMPEKCGSCDLFHAESPMHCTVVKGHKTVGAPYGMPRPEWCPLVGLPEKHGRLIDKDRLKREMLWNFAGEKMPLYDCYDNPVDFHVKDVEATINSQPTVIESEDGT